MRKCHSLEGVCLKTSSSYLVIPAKAGIQTPIAIFPLLLPIPPSQAPAWEGEMYFLLSLPTSFPRSTLGMRNGILNIHLRIAKQISIPSLLSFNSHSIILFCNMKKYFPLILNLCLIHFLLGLDINIVSVSLPYIASHFNVAVGLVSRVVWVYFLVLTCFLLAFGKLGDIKGFKKIYLVGIFVFVTGSALCYFANDFNLLVFSESIRLSEVLYFLLSLPQS